VKHYTVAELRVTDPAWVRDYLAEVTGMVERHGGRYLARTPRVETVEGEQRDALVVLIEWPSAQAAHAFYDSEDYRPHRERRRAGAENRFVLVAGEDVGALARMAD